MHRKYYRCLAANGEMGMCKNDQSRIMRSLWYLWGTTADGKIFKCLGQNCRLLPKE